MSIKEKVDTNIENTKLSDFDLAQKAAAGDFAAFEQIYWQHHRRVYGICMRMTKNVAEAEDLTQTVFLQLFRKIGSFRGDSAFSTWLHRMTVNTTLMHFRKINRIKESTTKDGELPEMTDPGNKRHRKTNFVDSIALTRAISALPEGYRRVLFSTKFKAINITRSPRYLVAQTAHQNPNFLKLEKNFKNCSQLKIRFPSNRCWKNISPFFQIQ